MGVGVGGSTKGSGEKKKGYGWECGWWVWHPNSKKNNVDDVLSEQSVQKNISLKESKGSERWTLSLRTIGVRRGENVVSMSWYIGKERTDVMRCMNENNNRRKATEEKKCGDLNAPRPRVWFSISCPLLLHLQRSVPPPFLDTREKKRGVEPRKEI